MAGAESTAEIAPERNETAQVRIFLFADIRGYTRFTQEHGDEAAAKLARKFAQLARSQVEAQEGKVTELRGDEALAVFTSARQALRAALELQRSFAAESTVDPSLPLTVGIGLDAGEAVSVEGGFRGGALNLAARLCSLAAGGEILASEGVTHLARKVEGLAYLERGLAPLKGFTEPVRIVEVVQEEAAHAVADESTAVEETKLPIGGFLGALPGNPIVGREAELKQVLDAVDAVAGGAGRLVMLAGEPGVGKTRLAQEVTLNVRNRDFLLATGRCYESHRTLPFYPFLDALAGAYAACPDDVRKQVPARWAHLGKLVPETGIEVPAAAEAQEEQQRLFRAVTGFLEAISLERPLGLLLDDLHWADEASLELLQHLARHTRADRILILGTYRDVEINRQHPLEAALRDLMREDLIERIAVRRLPREDTLALMAASFGGEAITNDFADVVYERTEGNAFFIQHVLRVLVERGDVFRSGERWTRKDLADIEVPESVLSVIGQRLEQLSPETQEALREASVLGQTFAFDQLLEIGERSEKELDRALEEAEARGLLRESGADELAFDHALTQQALYQELTGRRRRRLHLAAGEALEKLPEKNRTRRAGELAWHFAEGGDRDRAMRYALLAAEQAEAVYALEEAEDQYANALDMAEQSGDELAEIDIRVRRGKLLLAKFAGTAAGEDFERILSLARERKDRQQEVLALVGLARARYVRALDDSDIASASAARSLYEEAYQLAKEIGDKPSMVRALLGTRWLGDFWPDYQKQSLKNRKEALAISEEVGDAELILESKLSLWRATDPATGQKWAEELRQTLAERNDLHRLNELYFALMWAEHDWGNLEKAVHTCDAGIKLAAEIGVPPVQYPSLKAMSLADMGRFDEAWDALGHEVADVEHPFGRAMQTRYACHILVQMGNHEAALELLPEADRLAQEVQRAWMLGANQYLRCQALIRSGKFDEQALQDVLAQMERLCGPISALPVFQIATFLSEAYVALGRWEEALAQARRAISEAREQGDNFELAALLALAARALNALGKHREAVETLDQAREMAEKMRALPMLRMVETAREEALKATGDEAGARSAAEFAQRIDNQLAAASKLVKIPDSLARLVAL